MKVIIDKNIPDLTTEEIEEIKDRVIKDADDNPGEFKRQMLGVQKVVMSEEVARQLAEIGVTPDELIASMLKKSGSAH